MRLFFLFISFFFAPSLLLPSRASASINEEAIAQELFAKGVTVDLRSPTYCDRILTTDQGGVITGPNVRIQAQKMTYTRKIIDGTPVTSVIAEGDLIVEVGDTLFIGEKLTYDFQEHTGIITEGRTRAEPWFFGGREIHLRADGSYLIYDGFFTTSENRLSEWELTTERASLRDQRFLAANDVRLRLGDLTVLWIPSLKADLDWIFENPIRYTLRWGGTQGARVGVIYEFLSWNRWKAAARLDYYLKRGPGFGLEVGYLSEDHRESLETISYYAKDNSLVHVHQHTRYRFQGVYNNNLLNDTMNVNLTYDKLSDKDMATDYNDSSIELKTAGRTELNIRKQRPNSISNFSARVRLNGFQTVKQELPTFQTSWRPFLLGKTGIITNNSIKVSYLDFEYANDIPHVHNYESGRIEMCNTFYRPFHLSPVTITPEVGDRAIFYSNSPDENPKYLLVGLVKCDARAQASRFYGERKHVVEPYAKYEYYIYPTIPPNHHYIFDTDDGLYRLNALRFGVNQTLYGKRDDCCLIRRLYADLYAYAFFDTKTQPKTIPKVYSRFISNTLPNLRHTLEIAWDFQFNRLGHLNLRTEWTVSEDTALSLEYRHRDSYDWRKVEQDNFMLESFHSARVLRRTALSDRRDTLLVHLFHRFQPNWAVEFQSRSGWNRIHEPGYTEFEFDLIGQLRSACNIRLSYQHREDDDRIAIYFSLGLNRPSARSALAVCPDF